MATLISGEAVPHFDEASPTLTIQEVAGLPDLWAANEYVPSYIDIVGSVTITHAMARSLGSLTRWQDEYNPAGCRMMDDTREKLIANSCAVQDLSGAFQEVVNRDRERSGLDNRRWGTQVWAGNNERPKGWHFDFVRGCRPWIRHTLSHGMPGIRGVRSQFRQSDGLGKLSFCELEQVVAERYGEQVIEPGELQVVRFTPFTLHASHAKQQALDHNRLFLVGSASS